uniref:Zinc finger DHHC-type palmitoyltransferase 19 n=1 Tax=Molossus molossus TaxID=27622 RepID=A0A7J8I407_MOLMO|nr:zinc finger DHHC-type palmitoyltransferase 19 [Molossus molossus]
MSSCWWFSVPSSLHSLADGWPRTGSGPFPPSRVPSLSSPSSVSFHSTSQTLASYIKPLSIDKVIAIVVAVPAAGFLVPLFLLLLIQATSVSAAERSCEGKGRYLRGYNPFDHGCASNWYLTICAPLGPKYMAKAVLLQRVVEPDWVLMQNLHSPTCPAALCPSVLPGPGSGHQPQPLARHKPGNAPPGSGEAAALQELHAGPVLPLPWEAPR